MIVVFLKNSELFRRIIREECVNKNEFGQYVLPRNHFSTGWVERVWGIDVNNLPLMEFPTQNDILSEMKRINIAAG